MDIESYCQAVEATRSAIAQGQVYQANICRVMRASIDVDTCDIARLHQLLALQNPAPYAAMVRVPDLGLAIACASPELFLSRDNATLMSGPIKGTGKTRDDLTEKDRAENVMIVDLVRNDLARVSKIGTVEVTGLLREEKHPGLVHLVSHVKGELLEGTSWSEIFQATFPPGSVTGAPKISALALIEDLETSSRDFYCGAIGWIDADTQQASLSVAIRSFWIDGDELCFGTGAGITWGSHALREWQETELKAKRLVEVAANHWELKVEGQS
jgi:para-aminobenzoate synthetase component 1